jgi:CBS domain-containing protein
MPALAKTVLDHTAGDLMSRNVTVLHQNTSIREAARVMLQGYISGVPVVDDEHRCVGVLSTTDFLRLIWPGKGGAEPSGTAGACQFLHKETLPNGSVKTNCTLPAGACLLQLPGSHCDEQPVCSLPNSVMTDWQMIDTNDLPAGTVRSLMTADPVMVSEEAPIRALAQKMIDAHIRRVIVVDEWEHPLGIVSSSDILGAVAYAEE